MKNSRHELRLHHPCHFVIVLRALAQERVDFVNEHDARLRLAREREQGRHELVRLAVPLIRDHRRGDVDESRPRFFGKSFGEHCLATSWRAEEQHTFGCAEERGRSVEVGETERIDDGFPERGDDGVQSTNILVWKRHVESQIPSRTQTYQ